MYFSRSTSAAAYAAGFVLFSLVGACDAAATQPLSTTLPNAREVRSVAEQCVVAQGDHLLVTLGDVQALRGNVLPPPRQAEAVRLAVAAAVAKGAEVRGSSPVTHETPKEDPTPEDLAAYGRLVRHMQMSGGGSPTEVAARVEVFLDEEWQAQRGRLGPCGKDAPRWAQGSRDGIPDGDRTGAGAS
jgi:hypothetical protein